MARRCSSGEHGEHPAHDAFVLRGMPSGVIDLSVCWDQTDVRTIAGALRWVARELDALPEDFSAEGIAPLGRPAT